MSLTIHTWVKDPINRGVILNTVIKATTVEDVSVFTELISNHLMGCCVSAVIDFNFITLKRLMSITIKYVQGEDIEIRHFLIK